jgi:hypothetical protein
MSRLGGVISANLSRIPSGWFVFQEQSPSKRLHFRIEGAVVLPEGQLRRAFGSVRAVSARTQC